MKPRNNNLLKGSNGECIFAISSCTNQISMDGHENIVNVSIVCIIFVLLLLLQLQKCLHNQPESQFKKFFYFWTVAHQNIGITDLFSNTKTALHTKEVIIFFFCNLTANSFCAVQTRQSSYMLMFVGVRVYINITINGLPTILVILRCYTFLGRNVLYG